AGGTVRVVARRTPPAPTSPPREIPPPTAPDVRLDRTSDVLFEHFAAKRAPAGSAEALLAQLEEAGAVPVLTRLLDDLARLAEAAGREGRTALAAEILHRIVMRERDVHDLDAKRAFVLTLRRLSKGALLRAVAEELPRSPRRREEHMTVLARAGEDGADALIDQLVSSAGRSERRVYFDALLELRSGVPTLLHMLGDPRWFVARNAATLLGELQAREAEQPLGELLHHDDERVRHAATIALMRLGTPRSMPAIEQALRDGAPQIRMQAAAALAEHRDEANADPLIRALDAEKDDEVKAAFLLALGRLGSPQAVERLIAAAQPERGIFRKKVVGLRVAAVQALAAAGTPQALDALVLLQSDRESDVQQAALQALTVAGNDAWGAEKRLGP
ncbi:MAG: HEAT repeat domain-containing protein, partial [Gemmatimonadales bacterium]